MNPGTIMSIIGAGSSLLGGGGSKLREQRSSQEEMWEKQLQQRSQTGSLPVSQMQQVMGRTAGQQRQLTQTNLQARMMKQGLGSSIVTQELMRRTDRDTLSYLAEESRKISLANQMSKLKAQDQLGEYGMMRSNRLMNIAQANQANEGGGGLGGLLNMVGEIGGMLPGSNNG